MKEVYINPFTDFGFKKLFGEEQSKEMLIDFLNQILPEEDQIKTLTFHKNEHYARSEADRKAIFDLFCENEIGEKFIIELQRAKQKNFLERTIYYATFPLQEQAEPGKEWTFDLKGVYSIGILNFELDDHIFPKEDLLHTAKLMNIKTCDVLYDKLTFIYLETPKFTKTLDQLENRFDKWLYLLRNLHLLENRPQQLQERVFENFFEIAQISKLDKMEAHQYQESLKSMRDYYNTIKYSREEGREEGREEERLKNLKEKRQSVIEMLKENLPLEKIVRFSGLNINEVKNIAQQINKD